MSVHSIPVIDISDIGQRKGLRSIAEQLNFATQTCGFFYVSGPQIERSTIASMRREQRYFFEQSIENKRAIAIDQNNRGYLGEGEALMYGAKKHDQKEVFFWGPEYPADHPDVLARVPLCGPNQWPTELPALRKAASQYSAMIGRIGDALLRAFAVSLAADPAFFKPRYSAPMLRGQLLRYPPTSGETDQFGVAPHSDFGCITLLLQETLGLEVRFPDGEWVSATPIENTLVVNIGDLLERWSNGHLPSTKHRVRNTSTDPRYSIAMFYDPNPTATVDPYELLPAEVRLYEPIGAAEYILSRNKGAFAHYNQRAAT